MASPRKITLRAYQVGFGDCFLLTFHYKTTERHLLIDFGSTSKPKGAPKDHMHRVARSIRDTVGDRLHAVVATHRHKDHISGFSTRDDGTGTGDIIRALEPDLVLLPWTEDPDAQPDATAATRISSDARAFVGALAGLQSVAEAALLEVQSLSKRSRLRRQIGFLGETNLANRSAVENLMTMGGQRRYLSYGDRSGLRLPGVKVRILGPPTLEQSESIRKQRSKDESEFWHLQALASAFAVQTDGQLFDPSFELSRPRSTDRWLRRRLKSLRRSQLLEIVRALDKALNNTSLILLFEVGEQKLLFPGDAQIENWLYALEAAPDAAQNVEVLAQTTLYKVGHHGSLNATPKSLWNAFAHRSAQEDDPARLSTVVSTMKGKHGSTQRNTEVPRKTLVEALGAESDFHNTEDVKPSELFVEKVVELA